MCASVRKRASAGPAEHRDKYKHRHPHLSLGDLTPIEFAAACQNPPGCSQAPSASDEFRTHSRLPEPVNNPRNPRLESRVAIDISVCGNKTPNKPSIPKTNKKLS